MQTSDRAIDGHSHGDATGLTKVYFRRHYVHLNESGGGSMDLPFEHEVVHVDRNYDNQQDVLRVYTMRLVPQKAEHEPGNLSADVP